MKGFFKNLLASIIGCFIVLGLFFVMIAISLAAMMFSSSDTYNLKDNTIFTLRLEGVLSDRVESNPLLELFSQGQQSQMSLEEVLSSIKKAKENDKIKGIYITSGAFSASPASLQEIRKHLVDFKESGKFVVSYGDVYTQGAYYLSSVSDKVVLNPQGSLDLHGISASPTFYKGLLEKIGVEMQIFKVGTFKSAVEPFMLDKMSEANKEQVASYIGDIWSNMLGGISESRNISVEKLNQLSDSLPVLSTQSFLVDNKLVDTLMYETDVRKYLKTLVEIEESEDLRIASVKDLTTVPYLKPSKSKDVIAVLYAEGDITEGRGRDGITNRRYVREIEKLRDDETVKAVVFRVNSPGGSAFASEQIWKAVSDLKEKKPVVVSMGDYAASGGYYISCNANKIIAEPNTLTGSIGIFGMFPNVEGLTQKIGLTFDNVKTNKYADFGDMTRPLREDEKIMLQKYIERGYDLFLTRCSEGRGIPKDSLDHIAQGRVWTGSQALKIGLVDQLGGIDVAIEEAAKLAELKDYSLNSFPQKMDFFEALFSNQKDELTARIMKEYLGTDYQLFKTMKEIKEQDFMQARLPYDFDIR